MQWMNEYLDRGLCEIVRTPPAAYFYFYLCAEWMNPGPHEVAGEIVWSGSKHQKTPEIAETAVFRVFPMHFAENQVSEWHSSWSPSHILTFIYALNEWILGSEMVMKLFPNPFPAHIFIFIYALNEWISGARPAWNPPPANIYRMNTNIYRRRGDE